MSDWVPPGFEDVVEAHQARIAARDGAVSAAPSAAVPPKTSPKPPTPAPTKSTTWVPPGFEDVVAKYEQSKTARQEQMPQGGEQSGILDSIKSAGKSALDTVEPVIRGVTPYLAGAGAGAATGAAVGGLPGAAVGAGYGAASVAAGDLGISLANLGLKNPIPTLTDATNNLLTRMGLKQSTTSTQREIEAATAAAASALSGAGAASKLAERLGPGMFQKAAEFMAAGPKAQAVAGAVSGAAGQAVAESGGSKGEQFAAALAGGMGPGMVLGGAKYMLGKTSEAVGKFMFQGLSTPQQMQTRIKQAVDAGVTPDLAYVAPSMSSKSMTKALSGTETMVQHRAQVIQQMDKEATRIANELGPVQTPDKMGQILSKAYGKDGFMARTKATETILWDKWADVAQQGAVNGAPGQMKVDNTMQFLHGDAQGHPDAPALSALMHDKKIAGYLTAFEADMKGSATQQLDRNLRGQPMLPGTLPYAALKELRTRIGEALEPGQLTTDVTHASLKRLYGAITADMKEYAQQLGPQAQRDFVRANKFTAAKHELVDNFLQKTQGKEPAQVWAYASDPQGTRGGGARYFALNNSLTPAERDMYHATFINELGKDTQNEFNPITFVKNYSNLHEDVKASILPGPQKKAVDNLITVIKNMDDVGGLNAANNKFSIMGSFMVLNTLLHARGSGLVTIMLTQAKMERVAKFLTDPVFLAQIAKVNKVSPQEATPAVMAFAQSLQRMGNAALTPKVRRAGINATVNALKPNPEGTGQGDME